MQMEKCGDKWTIVGVHLFLSKLLFYIASKNSVLYLRKSTKKQSEMLKTQNDKKLVTQVHEIFYIIKKLDRTDPINNQGRGQSPPTK
jgi:hypothetical protein